MADQDHGDSSPGAVAGQTDQQDLHGRVEGQGHRAGPARYVRLGDWCVRTGGGPDLSAGEGLLWETERCADADRGERVQVPVADQGGSGDHKRPCGRGDERLSADTGERAAHAFR